ncbi:hypothetical protein ACU4GH_23590 [Bradyrhizobium betae]
MLTIQISLAKALSDVWADGFDDGDAAGAALKTGERRAGRLAAALNLAVGNDDKVVRKGEKFDIWKEISRADLAFLTAEKAGTSRDRLSKRAWQMRAHSKSTRRGAISCCFASSGCCRQMSRPRSGR